MFGEFGLKTSTTRRYRTLTVTERARENREIRRYFSVDKVFGQRRKKICSDFFYFSNENSRRWI